MFLKRLLLILALSLVTLTSSYETCHAADLAATGQTASHAQGDDGDLKKGVAWTSSRFTVSGACVTDTLTGLMWVKAPDSTGRDWESALAYANDLDLCGHSDWRLPNVNEIESLMNFGYSSPDAWLNSRGFSGIQSYYYWLSSTYANNTDYAHVIYMSDGSLGSIDKTWIGTSIYTLPVRGTSTSPVQVLRTGQTSSFSAKDDGVVRAGAAWPFPRYTPNDDCVTDNLTGLMWMKISDTSTMTWDQALNMANNLTLCGYSDWRLPNINELRSLMHYGVTDTAEWLNSNGFTNVRSLTHWSSTTSNANVSNAWFLDLANGYMDTIDKGNSKYVLPVRGTGRSTAVNNAPGAPTLVYPADGQTVWGTTVKFRWKKSSDPDNDPITYRLYTCTDPGFTDCNPVETAAYNAGQPLLAGISMFGGLGMIGVVFGGMRKGRAVLHLLIVIVLMFTGFALASCSGGDEVGTGGFAATDEITYTLSDLRHGVTHYWKVTADDGRGGTAESPTRSFSIR